MASNSVGQLRAFLAAFPGAPCAPLVIERLVQLGNEEDEEEPGVIY